MDKQEKMIEQLRRWEARKRMWYHIYLFIGVGICLILHFTKPYGFNPSVSIFWGSVFGLGIPLLTMFILSYLHQLLIKWFSNL